MNRLQNLIDEALPVLDPSAGQMKKIITRMRDELGLPETAELVWKKYLVFRIQGGGVDANRFHYFAVFDTPGGFMAANASGRIGMPRPLVTPIATTSNKESAVRAAEKKILVKMKKGYDVQDL